MHGYPRVGANCHNSAGLSKAFHEGFGNNFGVFFRRRSRHRKRKGKCRQMTRRLLRGDPPLEVVLRRSARARRFSLRVSRIDGRVTLSMPDHAREAEALAFAQGHAEWIRRALERNGPRVAVGFGLQLPVQGRLLTLTPAAWKWVDPSQRIYARPNQTPDLSRFKPAQEADYLWYFGKWRPYALPAGAKVIYRTKHSLLAKLASH